jgi:hypothetical protein
MAMLGYSYSIALGSGVALVSLLNIEDVLYPYTAPRRIVPRSQPVNAFPQRVLLGSGRERGDGALAHAWEFTAIPAEAVHYLNTWLFSGGTVVSTAVTIYTRRHELEAYARYNAWATLPLPGQDMEYIRQGVLRLVLRFTDLVAL